MSALAVVPAPAETTAGLSRRLAELLEQGTDGSPLPDSSREHATVLLETLRRRITRRPERDHRSLFDLDDRLIELMGMVEEAAEAGAAISVELAQEIDAYLEAYRLKVDQIVGYWRWQQSIADISAKEAGGVIDFTLKPKTKDTLFDSLRLSFRNGLVNDMQLIDSVGQRTNILFTGVKANEPIPASKFKFDIPKGADVIQE